MHELMFLYHLGTARMRTVLVGLALVAGAATAQAQEGFYIGGSLGASFPQDSDLTTGAIEGEAELDEDFVIEGHAGYRFPFNLRAEGSLSYRENDIGFSRFPAIGVAGGLDADATILTVFVNVYYDFDLDFPIKPFVGGGIGLASAEIGTTNAVGVRFEDDDTVFAFNLQAGASYGIAENLELFAGYRYIQTEDPTFDARAAGFADGTIDAEYSTHEVFGGLRVFF